MTLPPRIKGLIVLDGLVFVSFDQIYCLLPIYLSIYCQYHKRFNELLESCNNIYFSSTLIAKPNSIFNHLQIFAR